MKRHSPVDKAFLKKFAEELSKARDKAKAAGTSFADFAEMLGVTRAGLHKYLKEKSVPSLDVLDKARRLGVK